jgi:hypothetical protein
MISNIEVITCLLLLFMAVPDFCRKLGRPALVFPAFVVFGLILEPVVSLRVRTMLEQAGQMGFCCCCSRWGWRLTCRRSVNSPGRCGWRSRGPWCNTRCVWFQVDLR